MSIASTAIIHPNVTLGKNVTIEDHCIIGVPVGDAKTTIGDNAHIRSHTVIYAGNNIGTNFTTGNKANIRENNVIGDNVSVGTLTVIEHSTKIGNNVRLHSQVFVPEYTELQDNCWIGPNVVFTNSKYPNSHNAKAKLSGAVVGQDAIIGANATIMPGVTIGRASMIGAGSVVTKDTNASAVYFGNPAIFFKNLEEIEDYHDHSLM